jgi:phosphosulfolactate phosphohydrolase-like enzyme
VIVRVAHGAPQAPALLETDGPIVLFDALRMSATVIVALARGMTVLPVPCPTEALALKAAPPEPAPVLTAGEREGWRIPGLDLDNSPNDLLHRPLSDPPGVLVLTTSHGIPALLAVAEHARGVLVGSPLNLSALAATLRDDSPAQVGILLAGHESEPSIEDAMTASVLLAALGVPRPDGLPAPIAPQEIPAFFADTPAGRRLIRRGEGADLRLCARVDAYPIVPRVIHGRIVPDDPRNQGGRS